MPIQRMLSNQLDNNQKDAANGLSPLMFAKVSLASEQLLSPKQF